MHQQQKEIVIVPAISLMEDHFHNLQSKGIPTAYLGLDRPNKGLQDQVIQEESPETVIFVTPEWLSKTERASQVRALAEKGLLSLTVVDEAHLRKNFGPAYKNISSLKYDFLTVPILFLQLQQQHPLLKKS